MSLELLFLGTGTSAGVPMIGCSCDVCTSDDQRDRRSRPSVLIRYPRSPDHPSHGSALGGADASSDSPAPPSMWQFLIDTTPELRFQAIQHEIEWLDGVFLTHSHADHVMGLDDLRRFNAVMRSPLDLYAEPDTLASVKKMFSYIFQTGGQVNKTFIAQLVPHTLSINDSLTFGAASWKPIRLFHGNLPIVGYRIDVELSSRLAYKIAYCTDVSRIPDETFEHLQGLDVLVIDALRYRSHPTHMTVEQALHAIEMIRPKRAYLTHIAHDILHRDLQEKLPENVFLAYDGLVVRCE